jgi:hypothetical protein
MDVPVVHWPPRRPGTVESLQFDPSPDRRLRDRFLARAFLQETNPSVSNRDAVRYHWPLQQPAPPRCPADALVPVRSLRIRGDLLDRPRVGQRANPHRIGNLAAGGVCWSRSSVCSARWTLSVRFRDPLGWGNLESGAKHLRSQSPNSECAWPLGGEQPPKKAMKSDVE